jgi:hypothetical protein
MACTVMSALRDEVVLLQATDPPGVTFAQAYMYPDVYVKLTDTFLDSFLQGIRRVSSEATHVVCERLLSGRTWDVICQAEFDSVAEEDARALVRDLSALCKSERDVIVDVSKSHHGSGCANPLLSVPTVDADGAQLSQADAAAYFPVDEDVFERQHVRLYYTGFDSVKLLRLQDICRTGCKVAHFSDTPSSLL